MGHTNIDGWEVATLVVEFRITVAQTCPHVKKCAADIVMVLFVSRVAWLPGSHSKNATIWAYKDFASPM